MVDKFERIWQYLGLWLGLFIMFAVFEQGSPLLNVLVHSGVTGIVLVVIYQTGITEGIKRSKKNHG